MSESPAVTPAHGNWAQHRTGHLKRHILLIASLLLSFASHGQTLTHALEQTWARHPMALAQTARQAQMQAQADLASGLTPAPAALSLSNSGDRLNANTGKSEWEIELSVPLWLPGQRATRISESHSALVEAEAHARALRLQLAGELREAWWATSGARQAVELAQGRVESALALQADILRRVNAGDLARLDANLAQNERLAAESELLESRLALRHAEQAYQLLTGTVAPTRLAPELLSTSADTRSSHPEFAAVQAVAQLAQARLNVAEKSQGDAPELAVRWVKDRGEFNAPYANAIGVKLTLPLSSGARTRQDNSAALAALVQAQAELVQVRQRHALGEEKARLNLDVTQQQLVMAKERLALTMDSQKLAEKSFALGESDLANLLRARSNQFEAKALVDRHQTAHFLGVSRLNQTMGVLP